MATEEKTDRPADATERSLIALTETVTMLTTQIQMQNAIIVSILDNIKDFKVPDWETKEDIENSVGKMAAECIEKVNKLYGLGETDKS